MGEMAIAALIVVGVLLCIVEPILAFAVLLAGGIMLVDSFISKFNLVLEVKDGDGARGSADGGREPTPGSYAGAYCATCCLATASCAALVGARACWRATRLGGRGYAGSARIDGVKGGLEDEEPA